MATIIFVKLSSKPEVSTAPVQQSGDLERSLPRFGPCCGKDSDAVKHAKKEAWKQVVRNTPGKDKDSARSEDEDLVCGEDEDPVRGAYLSAIKEVHQEAINMYPSKAVKDLSQREFIEMMVDDGCFFLQWAYSVLGAYDLLGYSSDHLYFGENTQWIEAMFFVGNQIPCVVLRELLKQTFFKNIIEKGIAKKTWLNPPSDNLPKMVLYLLLVPPELREIGSRWQTIKRRVLFKRRNKETYFPKDPSDLLDATYRWILGSTTANMDHKVGYSSTTAGDNDDDNFDPEAGKKESDSEKKFQSATELKLSGIKIAKTEWGISKSRFYSLGLFYGRLLVSPFIFDSNSRLMLQCLKDYERVHKPDKNTRQVTSYLGFMKDLIQTPMDVELLEHKGVISLEASMDKNKLPLMLKRLCSSEEVPLTQNLRDAKLRATYYNGPERQAVVTITLFLTVVQTVATIVGLIIAGHQ